MVLGGDCVVQGEVGSRVSPPSMESIEKVGGGVQDLCPVTDRERHLKEKATDNIGGDSNHAFGPSRFG
jgi:hypothetical protein